MRRIANYVVDDEPIAKGGMGQIFRGEDDRGNVVAIKEILPEFATDWSIRTRIEKEVEFLLKCDHPSIVRLHLAFYNEATQNYYIVMEMVDGMNIEQYVAKNGPIPEAEAIQLTIKILDALQCVHNSHIIHRDIKPSNIMIRPNGDICLLDFGVAKDMDYGNGTVVGSVIGTDGYMSPEQANGFSVNYNTDIYSLGCVLYFMLTGHHAFSVLSSAYETNDAILNTEFPRLSKYVDNTSDAIQRVLDRATEKHMNLRYQNCYQFMGALKSGTHVSQSNFYTDVKISIGREKCDIIVEDAERKISRHHADVEIKELTGRRCYVFTDCSTNGTVVNGKLLHNASIYINTDDNPKIYLANVADGKLDWSQVVIEINNRLRAIQNVTDVSDSSPKEADTPFALEEYTPKEAPVKLVLAYLFALLFVPVGLILGLNVAVSKTKLTNDKKVYTYKESHRQMGLIAAILSVVLLCVNIVVVLNYIY
ncbi:MAG: protein kinase [Sodaliphilus sp.]